MGRSLTLGTALAGLIMAAVAACASNPPVAPSPTPTPNPTVAPRATPAPQLTPAPGLTPPAGPTPAPSRSPASRTPHPGPTAAPGWTPATRWIPPRGATWQWQLAGEPDLSVAADIFDLDGDETNSETVAALHAMGRHVICYVDVGTWESYRADAGAFPRRILGKVVDGWPDERWLDIRALDVLAPILEARIRTCADKGFDALEPDWLDAYDQDTGFPISRADSIRFDRWVAATAHRMGLGIAQKNAPDLVPELRPHFDFALVEECFQFDECDAYAPYLDDGVAVLDAEYRLDPAAFCAAAARLGVSAIRKRPELDGWIRACP